MARSSRIILTTIGSLGDLHPLIAIGLNLRERGHSVAFATTELYREKIAEQLERLFSKPRYHECAAEVARRLQAEDGARAACDAIERNL
jgi:rhamnosyltransferase subunit B